jgi:uncharacterized protein YjbI with pentapeptide repeats
MKKQNLPLALLIAAGLSSFNASVGAAPYSGPYTTYGLTPVNGVMLDLSPGANLGSANIAYAQDLHYANLTGANLASANLEYATNFNGANFSGIGTNLTSTNLSYATLNNANLAGATLKTANFSYSRLNGADLTGAILTNAANLSYAKMDGALLINANLSGTTNASYALLTNANLTGANLTGTVNLSYANLTGANWLNADLAGADLSHSTLSFSDWADFVANSGALNLGAVNNNLIVYAGNGGLPDPAVCILTNVMTFSGTGNETRCIDVVSTIQGTITKSGAGTYTSSGDIEAETIGTSPVVNFDIVDAAGRLNLTGHIASSVGVINKNGAGTLEISHDILTVSDLNVNEGTLAFTGISDNLNVTVASGATLKGSGLFNGNIVNHGTIAPGNSPGVLVVSGDYAATAGSLDLELANNSGFAGTSYDQLRVGGTITLANALPANYSTVNFIDFAGFSATRGDVFQVIAGLTGAARNTFDKFDLAAYTGASNTRTLLDHSTGKAYGTGLTVGTGTFRDYGASANQQEIGRALWMESIAYDKSSFADQNFASTALDPVAAAAQTGHKAFILTLHDPVTGEQATDLGLAAIGVLSAADASAALDSLSPEAYAGITDLGARVARGFVRQTFVPRRASSDRSWDFAVGYVNDELTSDGTSGYTSYKTKSDQVNVSASRAFSDTLCMTIALGYDDGRVSAQNFSTNVKTTGLGVGLAYSPDAKLGRFDVGVSLTSANWDATRGGATASGDDQQGLSAGARFTLAPLVSKGVSFSPFIGLAYSRARVDGFAESDVVGSVQLAVDSFSHQSLQGEIGLNASYQLASDTTLTGIVGWEHEFRSSGQTPLTAQFVEAGVTDTRFTVNSRGYGSDLFRLGLNFRRDLTPTSAVTVGFAALMGNAVSSGREISANYSVRF